MQAGEQQLWRVSNSSADTILDLQYVFDGVPQTLQLVAIDGVPVNSQDGAQPGQPIPAKRDPGLSSRMALVRCGRLDFAGAVARMEA